MLDVSVAYNRYKFLGYEFLTWLWFAIENDDRLLSGLLDEPSSLKIGNRLVMENRSLESMEVITITGDEAGLEEGALALKKGALVKELNLVFKKGELYYQFTIKAESLHIVNLKVPQSGSVETAEDIEGAVLEKAYLYEVVIGIIDALFQKFIHLRLSPIWDKKEVERLRRWITA